MICHRWCDERAAGSALAHEDKDHDPRGLTIRQEFLLNTRIIARLACGEMVEDEQSVRSGTRRRMAQLTLDSVGKRQGPSECHHQPSDPLDQLVGSRVWRDCKASTKTLS